MRTSSTNCSRTRRTPGRRRRLSLCTRTRLSSNTTAAHSPNGMSWHHEHRQGYKRADDDKIGRFGVGFKAVFAYSETPHIWSPTFSFKISDWSSRPSLHQTRPGQQDPFRVPVQQPKEIRRRCLCRGRSRPQRNWRKQHCFFSPHLKSIRWQIGKTSGGSREIQHPDDHVEVLKEIDGTTTASSHFLGSIDPLRDWKAAGRSRIRARLPTQCPAFDPSKPLREQLKIVPANRDGWPSFFPPRRRLGPAFSFARAIRAGTQPRQHQGDSRKPTTFPATCGTDGGSAASNPRPGRVDRRIP